MIHIIYNKNSKRTALNALRQRVYRLVSRLEDIGNDVVYEPYDDSMRHDLVMKHHVDVVSTIHYGEICDFVIYDDTRKGRFMTNESPFYSMEEVLEYFEPLTREERDRRRFKYLLKAMAYDSQTKAAEREIETLSHSSDSGFDDVSSVMA